MPEKNEILTSTEVSISTGHKRYLSESPYSPGIVYPEYPFGSQTLSKEFNQTYDGVRNAIRLLRLDAEHYGRKDWNPFGRIIHPGNTVVLKPNFIRDFRETQQGHEDCLITHGSIIRAALDFVYIALKGKGRIIIADASQNDADFNSIRRIAGLDEIQEFYKQYAGFNIEVYDLRPERAMKVDGVIAGHERLPGDPAGYVKVNLGSDSMFAEVEHLCHLLYGSEYDTSEIRRHHTGGVHEYLISKTVLEADCVINLPKLKTHKKTGITVSMKNLVGINGNKNWLPHHRLGTPAQGGDQFADDSIKHRIEQKTMNCFRHVFPLLGPLRKFVAGPLKAMGRHVFGDTNTDTIRSGNWYGNDTTWRMVTDLNRILLYADKDGRLRDNPVRRIFCIVDGIIGGEGNGPLDPTPKQTGVILAGINPLIVDLVCARLMGFNYERLSLLHKAMDKHRFNLYLSEYNEIICLSDDTRFEGFLSEFHGKSLAFKPHFGWKDHIEKLDNMDETRPDYMDEWIITYNKSDVPNKQDCVGIVFLGDVVLADKVGDAIQQNGIDFLLKNIPSDLFDAEILCFNLECCLSNRGRIWEPKPFHLRGLSEFLSIFPRGRCKYLANVANNHFLDYGEDAALDTLEALRSYGMQYFGLKNSENHNNQLIMSTPAGKVGFIGFAPSAHPLPDMARVNLSDESVFDMVLHVKKLKQKSDIVIASVHQGIEHTACVDRRCLNLTHILADAGADCVVCHHPHIIQGIETYKGVQIFHSIGNFLIDSDFKRYPYSRNSLALRMLLHKGKLHRIEVQPFIITGTLQPRPATKQEKQQIRMRTETLSSVFESGLKLNMNLLKGTLVRIRGQISGLCEMIRQKGICATGKYYSGRFKAKRKRVINLHMLGD